MNKQTNVTVYAVSMILKVALLAAPWAGKIRRYGMESIAKMPKSEKDKKTLFLRDLIFQSSCYPKISTTVISIIKAYQWSHSRLTGTISPIIA